MRHHPCRLGYSSSLSATWLPLLRLSQKEKALQYARRYPISDDKLPLEDPPETELGVRPAPQPPPGLGPLTAAQTGGLLQSWDFIRTVGAELGISSYKISELSTELRASSSPEPPPKVTELYVLLLQSVQSDDYAKQWWRNPPALGEKP